MASTKKAKSKIMKMNVEILSIETVKPSAPTPNHLRNFKVSLLDQFSPSLYVSILLFYNAKLDHLNATNTLAHLKEYLSETLTIYYPLAGRFKDVLSIDCNDEGVIYVEAQVNCSLSQFLENPDIAFLNKFLSCNANCLEQGSQTLVTIQTTRFKCGGLVIGACIIHKVVDASTIRSFLDTWAKITGGLHDQVVNPEFSLASSHFPPRDLMPSDFLRDFNNFYFNGSKFNKMKRFVFEAKAIATLQAQAASGVVPNPSRIEALTAFICKHIMAAYSTESDTSKVLMVTHAVNLRRRIEPPLPLNSFGNIVWLAYNFNDATETKMELSDGVELIREMFASVSSENLKGLDSNDAFESLSEVLGNLSTTEKLKILRFTSWCNMGFYDINFGWSKPVWVAYMGDIVGFRSKQHFLMLEGRCDKQIELWMSCDEQDMSTLENDQEFLAYATRNPSLSIDTGASTMPTQINKLNSKINEESWKKYKIPETVVEPTSC